MKLNLLALLILTVTVSKSQSYLDPTYASNGKFDFESPEYSSYSTKLLDDDKVLVAVPYYPDSLIVRRLDVNGNLDNTFGNGGISVLKTTPFALTAITSITKQPDGKLLLCGNNDHFINPGGGSIIRLNSNGKVDSSFAKNGFFTFPTTTYEIVYQAELQSDGKIIGLKNNPNSCVAGCTFDLFRLNANGSIDSTFGDNGGLFPVKSTSQDFFVTDAKLKINNDTIILFGANSVTNICISKVNPNGTLVNSYGDDGILLFDSSYYGVGNIDLSTNGENVYICHSSSTQNKRFITSYFVSNGSIDFNFGINGIKEIVPPPLNFFSNAVHSVYKKANGLVYAAHISTIQPGNSTLIIKYNESGVADSTYGLNSNLVLDSEEYKHILGEQSNGKVILNCQNLTLVGSVARVNPSISTNVREVTKNTIIKVYPNPVKEVLNVSVLSDEIKISTIKFYNIEGRLVSEMEPSDLHISSIDVSQLRNGLYVMKVVSQNGIESVFRVIKD